MSQKKNIAIDFDGVIHRYSHGWEDGSLYDEPVDGVEKALRVLRKKGYRVIIFTTRLNPIFDRENSGVRNVREDIVAWLDKNCIQYDELTNNKPPAIAYIDDRAIRFTNWEDVSKYF